MTDVTMRQIAGAFAGKGAGMDQHRADGREAVGGKAGKSARFLRTALATTSMLALALAMMTPRAAVAAAWNGNIDDNWNTAGNWTPNALPGLGDGTFNTVIKPMVIGAGVAGKTAKFEIGATGTGAVLTIQGGGTLTNADYSRVTTVLGQTALITVTGANSTWTIEGGLGLIVGSAGNGTLNISNGGIVDVKNGMGISHFANSKGIVNITTNGKLTAQTGMTIASQLNSDGTLNIGAGSTSAGTVETLSLSRGLGTAAQVNFDNGTLKALGDNPTFIDNFTAGQLNIKAGGVIIDSDTYDVTATSGFSGAGGIQKFGTGTLTMTGANTFTGGLYVIGGTLIFDKTGSYTSTGGAEQTQVAGTLGSNATLTVQDGGTFTGNYLRVAGGTGGSIGVVNVTGATSTMTLGSTIALIVGQNGTGTFNVEDGATVTAKGYTIIGQNGTGNLNVRVGPRVGATIGGTMTTTGVGYLGGEAAGDKGTGTATISGKGSLWDVKGGIWVGNRGDGTLTVDTEGTVTTADVRVAANAAVGGAASSKGTLVIDGTGSLLTNTGNFSAGDGLVAGDTPASVTISDGGTLTTTGYALLGNAGTGGADVTVTGKGSSWTINSTANPSLAIAGTAGSSKLTIADQGSVKADRVRIGGGTGVGTLNVESGGTFESAGTIIGSGAGATGIVTVTGTDTTGTISSKWTVGGTGLSVGYDGDGTLTIADKGIVTASPTVLIAGGGATAQGTLNVNTKGVLETPSLIGGAMGLKRSVTFNDGTLRALGPSATFISGFNAGEFVLGGTGATGGMTLDSQGFAVTSVSQLSGGGALTKVGTGDLTLGVVNMFTGGLNVNEGTVTAGAIGAFSTGLLTVLNGATANLAGLSQTVAGLSDNGGPVDGAKVDLGAATATLTVNPGAGVSSSFAGLISGTGGFTKEGAGAQILGGSNSYSGATTVSAGTLYVDGQQTGVGATSVASGATLAGGGRLGGDVTVNGTGRLVAENVQTPDPRAGAKALTIDGNLTLAPTSNLIYNFGSSPSADPDGLLIKVAKALDLGGATLDVTGSGFVAGEVYGLISYDPAIALSGTLVPSTTLPAGLRLQTSVKGRVNLVDITNLTYNFWNGDNSSTKGTIAGGDGVWQADNLNTNLNWREYSGQISGPFQDGGGAIFSATGGTVKVDSTTYGPINVSDLQFTADKYILENNATGDKLTLAPAAGSTDVGISVDAGYTATINAELTSPAGAPSGILKTDGGKLVLGHAGGNTYTGDTTIDDGTISIAAENALGQNAGNAQTLILNAGSGDTATLENTVGIAINRKVEVNGAGTNTFQTDAPLALNGVVSGPGALTKTGAASLTLGETNSFKGLIVNNGKVIAGKKDAFGDGALTVNANPTAGTTGSVELANYDQLVTGLSGNGAVALGTATLTVTQATGTTSNYSGIMSGGGKLDKEGGGNLVLSGANAFTGGLSVNGGTVTAGAVNTFGNGNLTIGAAGTADLANYNQTVKGLIGGGKVVLGNGTAGPPATPGATLTVNQGGNSNYTGVISGAGSVVKGSGGALTLSGANTFSGGLTINGGSVVAGAPNVFGNGPLTVNTNGTADLKTFNQTVTALSGTGGEVKLGGPATPGPKLTLNQTTTTNYLGTISGTGSLVMANNGKLTLSGPNTFSGGLTVNNGEVIAGSNSAFGSGVLTVNSGVANINGQTLTVAGLTGNGGNVALGNSSKLKLAQANPPVLNYLGDITGLVGSSIILEGAGIQTLSGDNSGFAGGLTVSTGTLNAGSAKAFGTGLLTVNGGTADLNGNSVTVGGIAGTGGTVKLGAQTLTIKPGTGTTYSGTITGGATGKIVKDGTGTQILSGNNSYGGGTTVLNGTLKAGSTTAFGASTGTLTVNGGIADLQTNSMSFAGLLGDASGPGGGEVKVGSGATLKLTPAAGATPSYAGQITGAGGLTVAGIGTGQQTLSGASTYSGATNVTGGTLVIASTGRVASGQTTVSGSGALQVLGTLSAPVDVNASGTLSGEGSITGSVVINKDGTLKLYDNNTDGIQKLTINGDLTVMGAGGAGNLTYNYADSPVPGIQPNALMLKVSGNVKLGGSNLNVDCTPSPCATGGVPFDPGIYGLIEYGGTSDFSTAAGAGTINQTLPNGFFLQWAAKNQLNLVYVGDMKLNYWNGDGSAPSGTLQGGDGIWTASSSQVNWTNVNADRPGPYDNAAKTMAMFEGTAGTVKVDGTVIASAMQFSVDGYTIKGGNISLDGLVARIVTGNYNAGADVGTTIESVLQDGTPGVATQLKKDGAGTLVLSGANTYSGGTLIDDGTISINDDVNLGAPGTKITFDGDANDIATLQTTGANPITSTRPVTLDGTGGTFQTDTNLTLSGKIDGTSGALTKTGAATLTLTNTSANIYGGGTNINAGAISIARGDSLGSGAITFNGGTLINSAPITLGNAVTVNATGGTFNNAADLTLAGVISGPATGAQGTLTKTGTGKLVLTADNSSYAGKFAVSQGDLYVGNNGTTGTLGSNASSVELAANTKLVFDRTDTYEYDGLITDAGGVTQAGTGTTRLTGKNTYTGPTNVSAGRLNIDGDQSAATGLVTVYTGGTLAGGEGGMQGGGTIGGSVVLDGGTLYSEDTSNDGANKVTIKGDLTVQNGGILSYNYGISPSGEPDALQVQVGGAVHLNGGTVNVTSGPGVTFDPVVYGLVKGAPVTGSGLTLANGPAGYTLLITSTGVNMALISVGTHNFWDGNNTQPPSVAGGKGGDGTWYGTDPGAPTNWTDSTGVDNGTLTDGATATFMGAPGTVTVDSAKYGAVKATGMQFFVDGYTVKGNTDNDAITLVADAATGASIINVGDRSSNVGDRSSPDVTATISAKLIGDSKLRKTDSGTLILTGKNDYTGGTLIDAGTLQILNDGNLGAQGTLLELDGGTLRNTEKMSTTRTVMLDDNGGTFQTDKDLTLSGSLIGGGGLTKTGAGNLILSAYTRYRGATDVQQGTLAAGAVDVLSANSAFNIGTSGTLDLRGYSQNIGALTNANKVNLAGSAPGATLTVNGNYTGKDGSTIAMSTRLEGDDSKTDRLHVKGATAGTTTLVVTNAGGGGAQTDNGIRLVEVDGASAGTFQLDGDYPFMGEQALVAGAYAYRLSKGGGKDPNDGDWYLRSSLLEGDNPQFQAGVPVYEAYAGVLQAFNQLDTMQNRLGNRNWTIEAQGADGLSEEVAPEQASKQGIGVWGNIEASDHRYRPEHSTSQTDYDATIWKAEAGIDSQLYENAMGRLIGGASLQYGTISADIASPHGDGKIDSTGFGIAGTLTWYGNNGLYLDGQARTTWYDSDLHSGTAEQNLVAGNDGNGYGLSIEAGKRIPFAPEWFVTPQAQLAWSRIKFDGFSDGFDATVTSKEGDSLLARMGVSVDHERDWKDLAGQTRRLHAYGLANLFYDFDSRYTVDVASTRFTTKTPPLWAGIGLGGSYNWNGDKYSLYGEALARTTLEDFASSYVVSGNVGLRVRW